MSFHVPLIIRGRVIEDHDLEFGGRRGGVAFTTPDVRKHLPEIVLSNPAALSDLYMLSFDDILDYLSALGRELALDRNPFLQEACELAKLTSGLTSGVVTHFFKTVGALFDRGFMRELAENAIGVKYLEGWAPLEMASGCVCNIRVFGARSVHILSGNVPAPSAFSVIRNAMIRSDAIFKTPSNDPITAAAIARTMVQMAPDHPITKHLTVAYWRGGDSEVEENLYRPDRVEKIIAWGGFASIKHISKYVQPGIDLITMDPKLSSSIVGRAAFAGAASMLEAAERVALDVGVFNQQACTNARVVYIETGTSPAGLETANQFGHLVFDALQALPPYLSGPAPKMDPDLAEEVQSLRMMSDEHKVFGGGPQGAVIVSQTNEPVDFARILNDRVTNLVPVDDLEIPIRSVTAYTQTIGIYPDSVKEQIRDRLIFNGAQRLTSLGYACKPAMAGPHDGMEPMRRMAKWVTDETNTPTIVPLLSRVKSASLR